MPELAESTLQVDFNLGVPFLVCTSTVAAPHPAFPLFTVSGFNGLEGFEVRSRLGDEPWSPWQPRTVSTPEEAEEFLMRCGPDEVGLKQIVIRRSDVFGEKYKLIEVQQLAQPGPGLLSVEWHTEPGQAVCTKFGGGANATDTTAPPLLTVSGLRPAEGGAKGEPVVTTWDRAVSDGRTADANGEVTLTWECSTEPVDPEEPDVRKLSLAITGYHSLQGLLIPLENAKPVDPDGEATFERAHSSNPCAAAQSETVDIGDVTGFDPGETVFLAWVGGTRVTQADESGRAAFRWNCQGGDEDSSTGVTATGQASMKSYVFKLEWPDE